VPARVTVVGSGVSSCGANRHNPAPVLAAVPVIDADIADAAHRKRNSRDVSSFQPGRRHQPDACDLDHASTVHSMREPERDARLDAASQLRFLEACARYAPRFAWSTPARARSTACPNTCLWMKNHSGPSGRFQRHP